MMYWMEATCSEDIADDEKLLQYACMHSFCEADRMCRRSSRFFTADQHQICCSKLEAGVTALNELAAMSLADNQKLYKLVPKRHAMTHFYDTRINPRRVTCMLDEDMVGRMKRIYVRCH